MGENGEGQGAQNQQGQDGGAQGQQDGQGQPQGGASGGVPDLKQANNRLNEENKSLKATIEQMQGQLAELTKKFEGAKTAEDIDAAVAAAKKEAEEASAKSKADFDARMRALTVQNALIKAGCADTVALMAHIDLEKVEVASDGHISGLDAEKLKESYPYLFIEANTRTVDSAASPGGAGKKMTRDEIAKVKDPAERRRLIAENMDLYKD